MEKPITSSPWFMPKEKTLPFQSKRPKRPSGTAPTTPVPIKTSVNYILNREKLNQELHSWGRPYNWIKSFTLPWTISEQFSERREILKNPSKSSRIPWRNRKKTRKPITFWEKHFWQKGFWMKPKPIIRRLSCIIQNFLRQETSWGWFIAWKVI